ncbi:MAG: hypothetical protein K9H25_23160 [Rhodospirillum sp.]|nr:hypothetical protein [Rhodospirillum sp.]MCF8491394.1 hypothetical protein [Rhodospirillum sp.]
MSRLTASSVGGDVFVSLREFHFDREGLGHDPDASALMTKAEAQAFARSLLALSQE